MNYNLTSFVIASMVVIVFMGSTATVAAKSNQLLRGGRAGRQLEKGNDDTILIPPFTATTNTTYADDTSRSAMTAISTRVVKGGVQSVTIRKFAGGICTAATVVTTPMTPMTEVDK
ncbi:hypothetical protein FRACYDRAFT_247984 [Fragilariopsis cylindrus CCMP1102]|uniref:Uncharacterized protein n=1 Tax=Fragilariopsis cylindrus CCMP1102 TaxID=635003 RepID=A0A1E7EUK8_9STRA|nr:hypothetical protein FRACYDRAFT_247984 [Fragilariopsis cylindrus CCMP1102]|eukprot:OEU09728.1 hypothetical protein FRACYDRAFT_247984 [Fragilariopsis cylindrus CCMP1102]